MLVIIPFLSTSAQHVVKVTDMPLTMAIRDIATVLDKKIPEQVRVVGIGDVTSFAKESTDISMAIAAFLISRKKFRHIVLLEEDWLLRPLNDYLTNKRAFDSTVVDSLVRMSMANSASRNASFRSFAIWLKKYNLAHPEAPVDLSGLVPDNTIIPAYFLATYIFPVDSAHGWILSKKWGANIYDYESAFKDIAAWYQQISKNVILLNKHKALLLRCGEDIDHNDVISKSISLEKDAVIAMSLKVRSMAKLMLKKSDKRTIIYGDNEYIAKSSYVFGGDTFMPLGLLLHEQLKDKYYTCLTDFADSSNLNQVDHETGKLALTMIPGSIQARELSMKKSVFFMSEDSADIKHYQPRTIFSVIGVEREIVPDNNIPATDALFIIKRLTSVDFLKRIYMNH
jgi:hypothetical protein